MSIAGFTITKHLVICELSIFGIQHTKLKVDRTLKENLVRLEIKSAK